MDRKLANESYEVFRIKSTSALSLLLLLYIVETSAYPAK